MDIFPHIVDGEVYVYNGKVKILGTGYEGILIFSNLRDCRQKNREGTAFSILK